MADWSLSDTWIVVTGALAAMACALPGNLLVVRRQSMMGDALSHAVLPGIVVAFLFAQWLVRRGWLSEASYEAVWQVAMFAGALVLGVLCALLTEWIHKLGKVESSAALGVVFTSLFALGLLLVRLEADNVHLDLDCVLYGQLETVTFVTGRWGIPEAAWMNLGMLLVNLLLIVVFYKELRIAAFDPAVATTLGIPAHWMHYALMAITAATLVAAFHSVGSILVIAMLIAPPATAYLLTERFSRMIAISLAVAALSAVLGHVAAITVPAWLLGLLGFDFVADASSAGMIAAASGVLFVLAMLFAPRHGVLTKLMHQTRMTWKIAEEDVLGLLYRCEESGGEAAVQPQRHAIAVMLERPFTGWLVVMRLQIRGLIAREEHGYRLTEAGRRVAEPLVRAHRLWESYMAEHFTLPEHRLHATAARVEHFLTNGLRQQLGAELNEPDRDPHGRDIPRP